MVTITSGGKRRLQEILAVRDWYQTNLKDQGDSSEREQQRYIWQQAGCDTESALLARLCLRCWLSHQISAACYQLASQFGQTYGFSAADLWPLVLDDDGKLNPTYQPLTMRILERYDPQQAALSTWADRMIKSHLEINRFCLERGLYRVSDWAILNDTPVDRLMRIFPELSTSALQESGRLLAAYHQVYRRDRTVHRQQLGRASRCAEPTPEQLFRIGLCFDQALPINEVLAQLCELANRLREHRITVRRGMPATQSLDVMETYGQTVSQTVSQPVSDRPEADMSTEDDFLQQYRANFISSLENAIEVVTQGYVSLYRRKKLPQDRAFLSALHLFHCKGLSMGEIAKQVGLKSQVQVTRLLKLKRFRAEVCAYWLNQIKQQVSAEALRHISRDRLAQISQQLEQILAADTEAVIAEAAAEAQISKNRETKSIFARRLCATLPKIKG